LVRRARTVPRMRNRAARWAAIFLGSCLSTATVATVRAESNPPELLDVKILRSDAILTFTVTGIRVAGDDAESVDIFVTMRDKLHFRWKPPISRIRVKGKVSQDGPSLRALTRHQAPFAVGQTYLAFMTGGPWRRAPFLSNGVFPIENGNVICGSGYVYGIDPGGFICGTGESHAGPPLTETELLSRLGKAIAGAKSRRPKLASHFERQSAPLQLERSREPQR